jgi:L-threonylcarbamoyladenylate synthase
MFHIMIDGPNDQAALQRIRDLLADDGVVAYPTDTVYGLGCDPLSVSAVERIYAIKGRSHEKPLLLLLDGASRLGQWCSEIPRSARDLIGRWPAPMTLILKVSADELPPSLLRGSPTLGFRVPASPLCRAVCTAVGGVITSTSVNRSGEEPLNTPDEISRAFGHEIDALVDAGLLPTSLPSTIVQCTAGKPKLVRAGAFPFPIDLK